MPKYDKIVELLKSSRSQSDLVKKVTPLPDNYILVDCNFSRAAKLHLVGDNLYVEADNELKTKLKQLINKLISEEVHKNANMGQQ